MGTRMPPRRARRIRQRPAVEALVGRSAGILRRFGSPENRRMRVAFLGAFLVSGLASASLEADPAAEWFRADAPHAYLVRHGETEKDVAARFVQDLRHWPNVWCPWPGYDPAVAIGPGDLLVRVRINGRGWVQRARLGTGELPHARALEEFDAKSIEPFAWTPDARLRPPRRVAFDLTKTEIHEPARAVHRRVSRFWPSGATTPRPVIRLDAGDQDFLSVGAALAVVPAGKVAEPSAWSRAVVAAVYPSYSYALLLDPEAVVAPGDFARSPTAWCVDPTTSQGRS